VDQRLVARVHRVWWRRMPCGGPRLPVASIPQPEVERVRQRGGRQESA